jgi:CheY-like chemotaxis protein
MEPKRPAALALDPLPAAENMRAQPDAAEELARLRAMVDTLTAQKQEAERANAAKSRFMAAVSHDLRQPMHALGLFIDELKGPRLPEAVRQLGGQMECALHSTQLLLDSVLTLSRPESGLVSADLAPFAVQPMLDRLRLGFEGPARKKGLRLRVVPSAAVVFSDVALLERILSNLLSNALRYTDAGGVLLACRRRRGELVLQVWDTGLGIAPEHQEAIFREFFRVERAHENRGGVGLGLAIVRNCAALLNGTVRLRSVAGRGSCFSLSVPLGQAPAAAYEPGHPEPDDEPREPFAGLQVLLVDNNPVVLQATGTLLARWGCKVQSADSAAQAEALLDRSRQDPDLVICDLCLGDGDRGTELVARLRNRYRPGLPALVVSADTSLHTAREVRRHGVTLLHKPLPPRRLRAAIHNLVGRA